MATLPDLDDLLDQIEGSLAAAGPPINTGRRGFFDPVPCFAASSVAGHSQAGAYGAGCSSEETEEKLSFVEFLKVTAKEAEELHQLQRLHDDQQEERSTKRVSSAAAVHPRPVAPPVTAQWTPPPIVVPDMPELPDVPDCLPALQQQNGRSAGERSKVALMENALSADKENRSVEDLPRLPQLHTPSPDLGVEMGEEAELEQHLSSSDFRPRPAASPSPCLIAIEEQEEQQEQLPYPSPDPQEHHGEEELQYSDHQDQECQGQTLNQEEAAVEAREDEDEEFDEVLKYLAMSESGSAPAPAAIVTVSPPSPTVSPPSPTVTPATTPEPANEAEPEAEPSPPSPIAVTPPTCNTAESFDVVSFQALPSDALNESELERELEELAQDFPDSDQPELVGSDENSLAADDTFFSAVSSLDRTDETREEEEGKEEGEIKDQDENGKKGEESNEKIEDGEKEIKDLPEKEEGVAEMEEQEEDKEKKYQDEEAGSTLAEERQTVDLVFINQPVEGERTAEVEDTNREEVSISIDAPTSSPEEKPATSSVDLVLVSEPKGDDREAEVEDANREEAAIADDAPSSSTTSPEVALPSSLVELVLANQPTGEERTAEVEDSNRDEVSIVIDAPPLPSPEEKKEEEKDEHEERQEIEVEEARQVSPMVSPSISGGSSASMEVVERADVVEEMLEEVKEDDEEGKIDEPVVLEHSEPESYDTIPERKVSIAQEAKDTVDASLDKADAKPEEEEEEMQLERVPEFAAVEEAGDSLDEEAEGRLRVEEEGEETPCFEVAVEDQPQDPSTPLSPASAAAAARAARSATRFQDRVISDVHEIDGDEAPTGSSRLTESELQLGKTPPIWIPDAECPMCMLCSARFTFLLRRHHCRACGRVLCAACCGERMVLAYQPDKGKARVCSPCASTLQRVEEHEKEREGSPETSAGSGSGSAPDAMDTDPAAAGEGAAGGSAQQGQQPQTDFGTSSMRKKSILKVRAQSVTQDGEASSSQGVSFQPSPSLAIPSQGRLGEEGAGGSVAGSAPRGVVFRDGIKPGEHTPDELAREEEERREGGGRQPQLRKKSRKRAAVSRRVAALKVEEQLASALPTASRPDLLVVQDGVRTWSSLREVECSLAAGDCVRIAVNRVLTVAVQICDPPYGEGRVMCAVSTGFHALGLDEVVFCWRLDESSIREDDEEEEIKEAKEDGEENQEKRKRVDLPMAVVKRIEEILQSCFTSSDLADVRRMATRMPRLHSSITTEADDEPPMTRHTMLVAATHQSTRHLPLSPSLPYVFAVPIQTSELQWALAAPNRVLLRLGLESGCYPTPLIISPSRPAVYTEETSSSVLKMFNDIGTWSYRMQHVVGSTVALANQETTVRIPKYARQQMRKIVEINRNMLAWLCDVNTTVDSHLICIETEQGLGPYESKIFQKVPTREMTGATFVIFDGALKTPNARVQVSVCEDGIAVRLPSEGLVELINALLDGKDHIIDSEAHRLRVQWEEQDDAAVGTRLTSPIDGLYLGNKMQYGITLERVISSTVPSPTLPETATRLSHVFNMRENLIPAEDEAKVFSVAELIANETAGMLDEYLPLLTTIGVDAIALRVTVERERIEYECAEWAGLEAEQARFRASLDKLVPVFVNVLGYIPHGFSIELWISIVSTTPLPIEI